MGLFRLLFWIAIIAGAFWLWRRFSRPTTTRPETQNTSAQPAPMVRCQHCGVHVPRDHALAMDEQWYCSQAHLEQGPRNNER
ncbi:PP0621 family protein [Pseudomonas sp. GLN_6]|uniref:PP0621 family protein n=1 Tax=unclassified Pseudomonas TaxID=196821 RepID=UPI00214F7E8E|nr:PP0621 family protein [Pseudomonas sp. 32.2.56]MCR4508566.1 PP0621 family protein [Pseudomonas sp. 32.2.56]